MPPLPPVPNVLRIVITNTGNDGRIAENVFHVVYTGGPPSIGDCVSIATNVWNSWVAQYTPDCPAQTSLSKVTVTDLASTMGAQGEYTNTDTPVPGTSTHGMLPISTAFLVSKFVARRYRGGHPRSYLPIGTTNDLNDDGDWKNTSYPNWVTSWATLIENLILHGAFGSTSIGQECSVTYKSKNLNPTPPYDVVPPHVDEIPIDGYSGGPKLATQRRRVRRTGHG